MSGSVVLTIFKLCSVVTIPGLFELVFGFAVVVGAGVATVGMSDGVGVVRWPDETPVSAKEVTCI